MVSRLFLQLGKTMKNLEFDRKRRSFLKLSGLLGLGLASGVVLPAEKAEAVFFGSNEYKVTKTHLTMGTYVTITVLHNSRDEAEQAVGETFEEIERLNLLLTRFGNRSPVAELNDQGRVELLAPEMAELVSKSLFYYQQTGGAFDITVKPLLDLYQKSFAANHQPAEKDILDLLEVIGSDKLKMQGSGIQFAGPNMGITLDGIAKGYIVDRASFLLTAKGITNHMINAGGDIRTSGNGAKAKPWTIAVQDPAKKGHFPDIIKMHNGAVATSGNYEVYYDQEKMFHHIVNGKNGHSPDLSSSVTVTAASVMDADALSTSVFVMGPAEGLRFINRQKNCECLVITREGEKKGSANWRV